MNPYPQKPNVTRTSKHEGSYSYEGMKREHKTKEEIRKDLEARWEAGELDETMKPYLAFLRGGEPPEPRPVLHEVDTTYHEKCKQLLDSTDKSLKELYKKGRASYDSLCKLNRRDFDYVSESYARCIYYHLKSQI